MFGDFNLRADSYSGQHFNYYNDDIENANFMFEAVESLKCCFMKDSTEYLGFNINKHGCHISSENTKAVLDTQRS